MREDVARSEFDRYERLKCVLPMSRLRSAMALVGGLGALGNEVGKLLALLGVGRVVVCDMDRVEIHNLTRSVLYRREDAGKPKVEAAASGIRGINPDVSVVPFGRSIAELGLGIYRRADMIFSTFDAIYPRLVMNEACMRAGRVWVDGGLSAFNAYAGMACVYDARDASNACFACSYRMDDIRKQMNLLRGTIGCGAREKGLAQVDGVPTTPMMGSVVAAMQVTAALAFLCAEEGIRSDAGWLNGELEVNIWKGAARIKRKKRFPKCYHHDGDKITNIEHMITEVPQWNGATTTPRSILERASRDMQTDKVTILLQEIYITDGKCGTCGAPWEHFVPRSSYRLGLPGSPCPACGGGPFRSDDEGEFCEIGADSPYLDRPLREIGVRPLDVLEVAARDDIGDVLDRRYYEVTGDARALGLT